MEIDDKKYEDRPEIYFKKNGEIRRKNKNFITRIESEGYDVIKNINNYQGDCCQDDIYLIQQFFIPKIEQRKKEVLECFKRNISNTHFKKIFLLNEKIYTCQELGIEEFPPNLVQIFIGKRMTYNDAFNFGKKLNGFIVVSNSDIFFDETILKCKNLGIEKYKCIEALCRYEFSNHKNVKKCPSSDFVLSSQDTWIIHSKNLTEKPDLDFQLGIPGCDLSLVHNFAKKGYIILSDNHMIRTYHYHTDPDRSYYIGQINPPWVFTFAEEFMGNCYKIHINQGDFSLLWGYPLLTEKKFFEQNYMNKKYVDIPWSSILYKKIEIPLSRVIRKIKEIFSTKDLFTCCQHIEFRKLIGVFKKIGIKTVYSPHKIIGEDSLDGIEIKPCPLYAEAVENDQGDIFSDKNFLDRKRKYIYSFRGSSKKNELTRIRRKIFSMKHLEDTMVKKTRQWHFQKIIYNNDTRNEKYSWKPNSDSTLFKELLADSVFTLCPAGAGPNTARLWESLGTGSIPVLLSDKLDLPPHGLWKEAIVKVPEREILEIDKILRKYTDEQIKTMRKNCLKIYEDFSKNYRFSDQ